MSVTRVQLVGNVSGDAVFNNDVGIGTTNPTSKLHIVGNTLLTGSLVTGGDLQITTTFPSIFLIESGGTATHDRTMLVRDNNEFNIRTRNSSNASVSTDYRIQSDASGATNHSWRIANTEKARLDSAGLTLTNVNASGIVTATTFVGALTGTASNVTTNANLTGDVTSVGNATAIAAGVIVNADINASAAIVDTKLATIATAGKVSDSALPATISSNITGNAATATALATARTINGVSFNGTANITATVNLGVTAGTTNGPIITSSAGTNATIPKASATASGVITTNAQTFAGNKTFTGNLESDSHVTVTSNASSNDLLLIRSTNTAWTGRLYSPQLYRSGNGSQHFSVYTSAIATTGDNEFIFTSNGNARADGSWTGGGADYAEFFEWLDGNPNNEDRSGMTVALDEEKIKVSEPGDEVIGVVSTNPVVVGDSAWNFWSQKYLRDAYSRHIYDEHQVIEWTDEDGTLKTYEDWFIPEGVIIPANAIYKTHDEDGNLFTHRRLNPDWDPEQEYIPRVERPEWDPIGLMGKLRIRKGQVVGERWIKMRDISISVEEWLVR
jgi:hypothetical protein